MPAALLGAAAQAIGGITNAVVGGLQRRRGRKLLTQIGESPNMPIPNEVLQNQRMAQLNANVGLPSEQYSNAMKNLERNQMITLRRGQDRRGGLSLVAGSQQAMNDGTLRLDEADAKARMDNQRTLYGVNNLVGNWRNRQWQNNVGDVWNRKYQYAQSLLGAGNQNATTGINQIAGGALNFAAAGGFSKRGSQSENLLRTDSSNYE